MNATTRRGAQSSVQSRCRRRRRRQRPHVHHLGWPLVQRGAETPSVNPSCGRWLALARCHRGGSPRASPRAASSPRDALATPHPGKRNDRAPPPPASPCLPLPLRLRLRLALQPRTRTRTHAPALAPRERSNPPSEFRTGSQKVPARTANRFDHRRWRFCKGTQGQCLI